MPRKEDDLTIMQRADKLIDELYRENDLLKEDKQFLHERCEELEQLVKEARALLDVYGIPGAKEVDDWLKRANALLEQGV